jgi:hypothetical protein
LTLDGWKRSNYIFNHFSASLGRLLRLGSASGMGARKLLVELDSLQILP